MFYSMFFFIIIISIYKADKFLYSDILYGQKYVDNWLLREHNYLGCLCMQSEMAYSKINRSNPNMF